MAQTVQAEADEPEFDGGCCSFWVPRIATEIIVVRGSGALQPADGDNVQGSSLIAYPEFGLGSRIENRLRDEAGIVQFRRSDGRRSEEHTSELQSLMRISYAVSCLKKK